MNRQQRRQAERNEKKALHAPQQAQPKIHSLLDVMVDGKEYESLIAHPNVDVNLGKELLRGIKEIEAARGRRLITYIANVVNPRIKQSKAIDNTDDLPFSEMISQIPSDITEVDVLIVTPGGLAQQVAKFVDKLRSRFKDIAFILPNIAMSAGTIWVMSGDEIIMNSNSFIGPIDPQVPNKDGRFLPAQALITLVKEIQDRGEKKIKAGLNPDWTDLQILRQIDAKELGDAINASNFSIELVENYLHDYKFRSWIKHSDGRPVTVEEKRSRAKEIASLLCDHSTWKTHSRGITREVAWDLCKLKITHAENISDLDRSLRRFWALLYWVFENTSIYKIFMSQEYCILRNDASLNPNKPNNG